MLLRLQDVALIEERVRSLVATLASTSVKSDQIVHQIPALDGNPKSILIMASWRTGSTFLTELIGSSLNNLRYLAYEPLLAKFRVNWVPAGQE